MRLLLFFTTICCMSFSTMAYQVRGVVTFDGISLDHASVRVKNSTYGVITNGKGEYFIELKSGTYTLVCSFVGMKPMEKNIKVLGDMVVDFELDENQEVLKTLVIDSDREDPAYPIMRKVIAKRKRINSHLTTYTSNMYLKATVEKENLKRPDTTDAGLVTKRRVNFIESYSTIYFKEGHFKEVKSAYKDLSEKQNSSQVTISFSDPDPTQPLNVVTPELFYTKITDGNFDFYQNRLDLPVLGEVPYTSPISTAAFSNYNYSLIETFYVGEEVVAKIRVEPKFSYGPLFQGVIYVSKTSSVLKSVDLSINTAGLSYFNNFSVIQDLALLNDSSLVTTRQEFYYGTQNGKNKATYGHTLVSYSNYNLNVDIKNRFMNRGQVVFEDSSYDAGTDFWKTIRPTGLKRIEQEFIKTQDSIRDYHLSDAYLDMQDSMYNSLDVWDFLLNGIVHRNREKGTRYYLVPLIQQVQINNIDGYRHTLGGSFTKRWTKEKDLRLNGGIDYGFTNQNIRGDIQARFLYNPKNFSRIRLYYANQYTMLTDRANISGTLSPSNYAENQSFGIGHEKEWWNGFFVQTYLDYNQFAPFNGKKLDELWDLFPDFKEPQDFEPFEELVLKVRARITFKQQYEIKPYKKVITGSKYPVLNVTYSKGIKPFLKSDVNYDYLQVGTKYTFKLFKMGTTRSEVQIGRFLNDREVRLSNLKYIRGSDKYYFSNPLQTPQLIRNVGYQTARGYFQAGLMHHFNGQILNKVPVLKKTGLQIAGGGFLLGLEKGYLTQTDGSGAKSVGHAEIIAGLERPVRMFKQMFRFGVYYAVSENSEEGFNQGFKVGIDFYNTVSKLWQY